MIPCIKEVQLMSGCPGPQVVLYPRCWSACRPVLKYLWSLQGTFREMVVYNPRTQHGALQPGQWDYFEMALDPMDTSWMVKPPCLPCAAHSVIISQKADLSESI